MRLNRRRDNDRVQSRPVEQVAVILVPLKPGIERFKMGQPLLAGVTHQLQAAILQLTKIPDKVWTPISTPHHAEVDRDFHMILTNQAITAVALKSFSGECVLRGCSVLWAKRPSVSAQTWRTSSSSSATRMR